MTNPMANPSVRALKRRSTEPKADFTVGKHRAKDQSSFGVAVARKHRSTASAASASEIAVDKPLTEKQRLFVEHWAKGDSIPNACLRAGFASEGLGYRLVRMPNVLALKAQYEAKYEEVAQLSRKKVMDMHIEAFEMAKLMSEPSTMVAAARELGKMAGYYAPVEHKMKVDVTGNIVVDRLNGMSDAELLKVITQGALDA